MSVKNKFELIKAIAERGVEKAENYWPGELRSILNQITEALQEAYVQNPDKGNV